MEAPNKTGLTRLMRDRMAAPAEPTPLAAAEATGIYNKGLVTSISGPGLGSLVLVGEDIGLGDGDGTLESLLIVG